ncbi:MAG: HEAT repeat domain-containing protein [Synechococcales cyanobacterium RM1_1_8]|nr:HEAT repeat domain-containing protein [Synechococcales cyanobacterium RM1_1_8]
MPGAAARASAARPGASRSGASRPGASQDPSNPSAHPAAPPGQLSPSAPDPALATSPHSLTPPPPPSEIAWAGPPGRLEQPDLVTSRLARVDIVEVLVTDLQSVDPAKRRKAIWELGQRSDSRAIQPLVNLMASSDSRQRSLILSALSEIGTQTLKPMKQALAISLQDENPEVRKNAIRDLTRIYDLVAQISHLLNAALEDSDPEVQETARWALKQLNRIRSTTAIEGSQPQQVLQQSVSPPESFAEDRPGQS